MCHDICKGIRGWCRSFTKLEILLSLLEALQLVLLIALLTFVILHFIACLSATEYDVTPSAFTTESHEQDTSSRGDEEHVTEATVKCTWKPSHKTKAVTQYYLNGANKVDSTLVTQAVDKYTNGKSPFNFSSVLLFENPDGVEADSNTKGFVAALVEVQPAEHIFGCILTIISEYWSVTAASCIDSLHMYALDNFGIMYGYDEDDNDTLDVKAIIIHPNYHRHNTTSNYDLGAVQSGGSLTENGKTVSKLPAPLDFFVTTIGEGLTIIGFGKYRSVDSEPLVSRVYEVFVHVLPWGHCGRNNTRAELSLVGGVSTSKSRHDVMRGVCAGATTVQAGGGCRYCAGTPLLRLRTLLALMTGGRQCALGCRPAQYVSLAQHVPWLRTLDTSI